MMQAFEFFNISPVQSCSSIASQAITDEIQLPNGAKVGTIVRAIHFPNQWFATECSRLHRSNTIVCQCSSVHISIYSNSINGFSQGRSIAVILSEISIIDVVLEGIKVLGMCFLLGTLVGAGNRYPALAGKEWNIIIIGFVLMLVGFAIDWSDEWIDYEALGNNVVFLQAFIEEAGLIGGLFLVTYGFSRWFNFVSRFMGIAQE